jgi:(p)ppGpp synthase/HD superfamily hydrolase
MKNIEELYHLALSIATVAHKGQKDKAGADYISHPMRVARRCSTKEQRIVALLHDVIEDTDIDESYLLDKGFPAYIVDALSAVTRNDGESYEDFIMRSKQNPISRVVKLHDLEDNLDVRRLERITEKDSERINKYLKAYRFLLA